MQRALSKEKAALWDQCSEKLRQVTSLLGECEVIVKLQLNITEGRPVEALEKAILATNGLSYMFLPQDEWLGGDKYIRRLPHIMTPIYRSETKPKEM